MFFPKTRTIFISNFVQIGLVVSGHIQIKQTNNDIFSLYNISVDYLIICKQVLIYQTVNRYSRVALHPLEVVHDAPSGVGLDVRSFIDGV